MGRSSLTTWWRTSIAEQMQWQRGSIATRHAVTLPFRASNRSYHLVLDTNKMEFMAAIVAIDRAGKSHSASVVTVLTREQFEADAGPIGKMRLRTAASRVLDPVAFRRWERTSTALRLLQRLSRHPGRFRDWPTLARRMQVVAQP